MGHRTFAVGALLVLSTGACAPVERPTIELAPPEILKVVVPRVTMDVEHMPIEDAVAQIADQAGIEVRVADELQGTEVTLHLKDAPVQEAFGLVVEQTDSYIWGVPEEGLVLHQAESPSYRQIVGYAGPCLLVASPVTAPSRPRAFLFLTLFSFSRPTAVQIRGPLVDNVLDQDGTNICDEEDMSESRGYDQSFGPIDSLESTDGASYVHIAAYSLTLRPTTTSIQAVRGRFELVFALDIAEATFDLHSEVGHTKKAGPLAFEYQGVGDGDGFSGPHSRAYIFAVTGDVDAICAMRLRDLRGENVPVVYTGIDASVSPATIYLEPCWGATVTFRVVTESFEREYPFEIKDIPVLSE